MNMNDTRRAVYASILSVLALTSPGFQEAGATVKSRMPTPAPRQRATNRVPGSRPAPHGPGAVRVADGLVAAHHHDARALAAGPQLRQFNDALQGNPPAPAAAELLNAAYDRMRRPAVPTVYGAPALPGTILAPDLTVQLVSEPYVDRNEARRAASRIASRAASAGVAIEQIHYRNPGRAGPRLQIVTSGAAYIGEYVLEKGRGKHFTYAQARQELRRFTHAASRHGVALIATALDRAGRHFTPRVYYAIARSAERLEDDAAVRTHAFPVSRNVAGEIVPALRALGITVLRAAYNNLRPWRKSVAVSYLGKAGDIVYEDIAAGSRTQTKSAAAALKRKLRAEGFVLLNEYSYVDQDGDPHIALNFAQRRP